MVGRPRNKQPVDNFKDVDVVQRGPMRDEGASRTREGAIGYRGRGGAAGSRGGASGSRGRGIVRSRGGASGPIEQSQDEPEKTQSEPQHTQNEP
ncbi:hypothetical protein Tco_0652453 [Tanacetum coccineum]|uniref:Uncharacterized protein n=1 Tax=Tanacetum coccineum TaxID=301880 RepID=A0ABQ4WXL4_9ASTR